MKRIVTVTTSLLLILIALSIAGCWNPMTKEDPFESAVASDLGVETEDVTIDSKEVSKTNMNDSHSMMAAMILNNAGYDSDLTTYDDVYLCDVTLKSTGKTAKFVVFEKNGIETRVMPANISEQLE